MDIFLIIAFSYTITLVYYAFKKKPKQPVIDDLCIVQGSFFSMPFISYDGYSKLRNIILYPFII